MKTFVPLLILALSAPLCARATPISRPVLTGAVLSTNLSAAVLRLDESFNVSAGSTMTGGLKILAGPVCPGGNCVTGPIRGLPCDSSPENATSILAMLGMAGLLLGRFGYGRLRTRAASTL